VCVYVCVCMYVKLTARLSSIPSTALHQVVGVYVCVCVVCVYLCVCIVCVYVCVCIVCVYVCVCIVCVYVCVRVRVCVRASQLWLYCGNIGLFGGSIGLFRR